ncbi:cation/calcium exchanger 1-like [Thraustotheca clavata]|uniref:Cation/calcium exchanger 1-like n=1 Tax=Thraustotheca clavata TaxID=74557 RepID=A0A1V9Y922_9STRA|nr:cation/calcium exchanger 1-like [Thraustotheca clavata]
MSKGGITLLLVLALVNAAAGIFIFPDDCGRPRFVSVPEEFKCSCAHATRVSSLDYLSFHYCTLQDAPILSLALLSVLLSLLFYVVGNTTDRYMVPAVTYISKATKLDPSFAGATLLAFANGAPDLFSCVASFSGAHTHSGFGVGGLLGSGLVVTVFTFGYLAYLSGGFDLRKQPFMRDVFFYFTTVLALLAAYRVGYITVPMSLIALTWYAVYTFVIVKTSHKPIEIVSPKDEDEKQPEAEPETEKKEYVAVAVDESEEVSLNAETISTIDEEVVVSPRSYWSQVTNWDRASTFKKCSIVALCPLLFARHYTVPIVQPERVSRSAAAICVFAAPLFILSVAARFMKLHYLSFFIATACSVIFSAITWFFCRETSIKWRIFGAILTLFLSSLWVFVIGHEIVAIMFVLGVSLGISSGTLGILVLAWGNSIGDFVGNRALVRQGHVHMATAACVAGPIFNTLVGGGFAIFLGCLQSETQTVPIWSADQKAILVTGFVILALALISLLALGCCFKDDVSMSKTFGLFLIGLYMTFCAWTLCEETQK